MTQEFQVHHLEKKRILCSDDATPKPYKRSHTSSYPHRPFHTSILLKDGEKNNTQDESSSSSSLHPNDFNVLCCSDFSDDSFKKDKSRESSALPSSQSLCHTPADHETTSKKYQWSAVSTTADTHSGSADWLDLASNSTKTLIRWINLQLEKYHNDQIQMYKLSNHRRLLINKNIRRRPQQFIHISPQSTQILVATPLGTKISFLKLICFLFFFNITCFIFLSHVPVDLMITKYLFPVFTFFQQVNLPVYNKGFNTLWTSSYKDSVHDIRAVATKPQQPQISKLFEFQKKSTLQTHILKGFSDVLHMPLTSFLKGISSAKPNSIFKSSVLKHEDLDQINTLTSDTIYDNNGNPYTLFKMMYQPLQKIIFKSSSFMVKAYKSINLT